MFWYFLSIKKSNLQQNIDVIIKIYLFHCIFIESYKNLKTKDQDKKANLTFHIICIFCINVQNTRHWRAKSYKFNGIARIFEVDKAAQMASNVADDNVTNSNNRYGYNQWWISLVDSCAWKWKLFIYSIDIDIHKLTQYYFLQFLL